MMLGITVMKVMGLKPLLDTPLKGDYMRHDIPRLARIFGVPLKMLDDVPSPLAPARAFYWLDARDPALAKQLAQRLYQRLFARGEDISAPDSVAEEAAALGIARHETLAALQDGVVKQRLHAAIEASIAKGVFGSPFFIIDGEPIWGCDRLWMVEKMLQDGRL
jgi:2-hydroxychromene-2-carboxylate isomerase